MLSKSAMESGAPQQSRSYGEKILDGTLAISTLVVGMFFPVVSAIAFPDGLVNVLWGSLYGTGFGILHSTIGAQRGGVPGLLYVAGGFFIWPGVVAYAVGRILKLSDRQRAPRQWLIVRALMLLSLLVAIPIPSVQEGPWEHFPIFTKYIDF